MNEIYTVKKGDTLWGISNQYGVLVTELASLNNVTADSLQVGQTLIIPVQMGTNPDNMFYYTVKKGDTLWGIAKVYGTSVQDIKKLNYLEGNQLYIGQVLRIPEIYTKPEEMGVPNYLNYVVQKGDTLYSISKRYHVSVDTIMQDNALSNGNLVIGQNLKIRTTISENVDQCFGEDYQEMSNTIYIVQQGDTLWGIARKFNVEVSDLMLANSLQKGTLSVGEQLVIPNNRKSYIVQKGDTLYNIAKKFGTTVSLLMEKNQLSSSNLAIGQILVI